MYVHSTHLMCMHLSIFFPNALNAILFCFVLFVVNSVESDIFSDEGVVTPIGSCIPVLLFLMLHFPYVSCIVFIFNLCAFLLLYCALGVVSCSCLVMLGPGSLPHIPNQCTHFLVTFSRSFHYSISTGTPRHHLPLYIPYFPVTLLITRSLFYQHLPRLGNRSLTSFFVS